MTKHANCTHPATKTARAKCRKLRVAEPPHTQPQAAVAEVAEVADRDPKIEKAYMRYISDGLADTDGYYAPVDYEHFAATMYLPS
jgi:hypothetical protein